MKLYKRLNKMPITKLGEKITWGEFFRRWKQGIEGITPLQRLKNDLRGTFITLLGFIVSFIAVIYLREKIGLLAYGLILIFLGSIITTFFKWIALRQQVKVFLDLDNELIGSLKNE